MQAPATPGFSVRRLIYALWYDPTAILEIAVGLWFFLLRGSWLVYYGYTNPGIEYFLSQVHLSEAKLGLLCVIAGIGHIVAAGTHYYRLRAAMAAFGVLLGMIVILTFQEVEAHWHPVAVVWASVVFIEFTLMVRNFAAITRPRSTP